MSAIPRLLFTAAVLLFAAGTPAPAAPVPPAAGKAVTFPYPAKAPLVVQLNGVEQAQARLKKMLAAALPNDAAKLTKEIDGGLKKLLAGRKTTAIPPDGRVFLVVHDFARLAEDEPAVSLLLPVAGYKEFRDTFLTADERKSFEKGGSGVDSVATTALGDEKTVHLVDLSGYVVLTIDKTTAEVFAAKYTRATSDAMGPDIAATFLAADLAIFINLDIINDLYGEQIRQARGLLDFALMQAQQGGMLPGLNKKQAEAFKVVVKGMFQGVEDCRGAVIGVEFRPEGLNARLQARFADDTPSGRLLKDETPGSLSELAALPKGLMSYGGSRFGAKFADVVRGLGGEFTAPDDDETLQKKIDKLVADVAAAGSLGEYSASTTPEATLTVAAYKEPAKAAAALTRLYQALPTGAHVQNVVLRDVPKVTTAARKHGGVAFTEVRLSFDFEATVKDLPDQLRDATLASIKRMTREKSTLWIGSDGKRVLTVGAKDWDAAAKLLDAFTSGKVGVGAETGFQLTRKNLPAEASLMNLTETGQTIRLLVEFAKGVAAAVPDFPLPLDLIKPATGAPTYLGLAVTLKPETATVDVFVPGPAMTVGMKMLAPLFKNIE